MARLSNPRTVLAVTSPRTLEKTIPEIDLLIQYFDGQVWNPTSQIKYFDRLYASPFYDGESLPKDKAFAARDRINRAPKALGFVDLGPVIDLTEAGERLLGGKRIHETFAKQLFKFQLPSPYHLIPDDSEMNIRPYLELLRLFYDFGELSKKEIAMFFVPTIHYSDYSEVVKKIKAYRTAATKIKTNRKKWIQDYYDAELKKVYDDEISAGKFDTRQSKEKTLKKFLATKRGLHNDYADALVRYLRATQLITFNTKTLRPILAPSQKEAAKFILDTVEPSAWEFANEDAFKAYMFNPEELQLLTDDRDYLIKKLDQLKVIYKEKDDIGTLKDLLEAAEIGHMQQVVQQSSVALKNYQEFDDVIDMFDKIKKKEVPDTSLFLEWNVWRSIVMINYVKDCKGNFSFDFDGVPLSTAQGNKPDIQAEYDGFNMIVEVTMSAGNTQFNMEGESVARHFGNVQKDNNIPAYCIFIAPKISEGTLAHFFNLNRFNTKMYGGKTRIVPMTLDQFISFIRIARDKDFKDPKKLKAYLDGLIEQGRSAADEDVWFGQIDTSISRWVN